MICDFHFFSIGQEFSYGFYDTTSAFPMLYGGAYDNCKNKSTDGNWGNPIFSRPTLWAEISIHAFMEGRKGKVEGQFIDGQKERERASKQFGFWFLIFDF